MHVGEVWFWRNAEISIYRLVRGSYKRVVASTVIPSIDPVEIATLVSRAGDDLQVETVRAFRASVRGRPAALAFQASQAKPKRSIRRRR